MGGFKVFNENPEEQKQRPKQSPTVKRKTWKSDNSEKNPVRISRQRSEPNKELSSSCEDSCNEVKRSPVLMTRRSNKDISNKTIDGVEKSSIGKMKMRSEDIEIKTNQIGDLKSDTAESSGSVGVEEPSIEETETRSEEIERNPVHIGRIKSEVLKISGGIEVDSSELREVKTEEIEKKMVEIEKVKSDCDLRNLGFIKAAPEMGEVDDVAEEMEDRGDEKQSICVEELIKIPKTEQKQSEEKKINQGKNKPVFVSSPVVKKQSPDLGNYSRNNENPAKNKAIPALDGFQSQNVPHSQRVPQSHSKLQSLIDLVMWRDASRSAFVFGMGTFIIISSSYTKDLNISLISVFSYSGLVYLAAIFLFRSIVCRGVTDIYDTSQDYVVGEEEAVWLLKMVLPYLNEFLIKLRALFSGDPSTTMKLAVLLFVLARCGSSITIWKMAKLGFFGVFTVPKICALYSTQLTAYGNFYVRRFRDAWESCAHKKAVGFGIFTIIWNLSSVVARLWAVFMLYVAFRYYQQSMIVDDFPKETPKCQTSRQGHVGGRRIRRGPAKNETIGKEKKLF